MPPDANSGRGTAVGKDPFDDKLVKSAAAEIFGTDPRVRSVGVGRRGGRPEFVSIRNASIPVPLAKVKVISDYQGVPVAFLDSAGDPESLILLLRTRPGSSPTAGAVPEQNQHRPVVC